MILDIITDKEKLSIESEDIDLSLELDQIKRLIVDMKETLRTHVNGVGLSAIQVGVAKRLFIINFNRDIRTFINPLIDKASGLVPSIEGCLSLPGKTYLVPRYQEILVFYQTPLGKTESMKIRGFAAKVFQHEYDHLVGVTLDDIGLEFTEDMKNMTNEELVEIVSEVSKKLVEQRESKGENTTHE